MEPPKRRQQPEDGGIRSGGKKEGTEEALEVAKSKIVNRLEGMGNNMNDFIMEAEGHLTRA